MELDLVAREGHKGFFECWLLRSEFVKDDVVGGCLLADLCARQALDLEDFGAFGLGGYGGVAEKLRELASPVANERGRLILSEAE